MYVYPKLNGYDDIDARTNVIILWLHALYLLA